MNEGWTTPRVINVMLLLVVLFVGWHSISSLDRQQQMITRLETEVREGFREVRSKLDSTQHAPQYIISRAPDAAAANTGTAGSRSKDGAGEPGSSSPPARALTGGKDAIGRPQKATPGYTLYPPPGTEIPGRTTPRRPDFIPPLNGSFTASHTGLPDKTNYYLTNDGIAARIDRYMHERLFTIDPDDPTRLLPELAVAWEESDDKLSYLFHLRRGVRFSDGTPFDAADVLFTYNMLVDDAVESEHLRFAFNLVENVTEVDPFTVKVTMKQRYWKALKNFGYNLRVFPQEYYEREIPRMAREHGIEEFSTVPGEAGFGEVFNKFREAPPGTGPYKWVEGNSWITNQSITLYPNLNAWIRKLNPDYFRIETLRWRLIRDRVAQFEEFRKEKLDILVVDHDAWEDQLSKDKTITDIADHYVYDHIGILYSYVLFNCRRPPFDDPRVRVAMAHLIDRQTILQELERGNGSIATCMTKPIYPEYSKDIEPWPFDPKRAVEILNEAGWEDSDGDGLLDKDGEVLAFTFTHPAGREFFEVLSTLLLDACRSAGVRCRVDPVEWSVFLQNLYEHKFDMMCLYASARDPWIDLYEDCHSSQTGPRQGNYPGWKNAEADRLLERMRREFDDAARTALFHKFNKIFHAEMPRVLLVHAKVGVLVNKRLKGVKVRVTGLRRFDLWVEE